MPVKEAILSRCPVCKAPTVRTVVIDCPDHGLIAQFNDDETSVYDPTLQLLVDSFSDAI